MSNDQTPHTLLSVAALDERASVQIPNWEQSIFACADADKDYGEAGVLFPAAPDETGMEVVTDYLNASKNLAPQIVAMIRELVGEWEAWANDAQRYMPDRAGRAKQQCAAQLTALLTRPLPGGSDE